MAKSDRISIIDEIQRARESHLIAYITSTRQGLEVQMAMDSIRIIYEHLRRAEPKSWGNVDLFLYSNGGDSTVPWRLVTLIREKAKRFSVLVPFRAFSAATLTSLGADSIVMHPMGMLGPTDFTVTNGFNPIDNLNPTQRVGISVEDVTAYISLIKDDVGIHHEDELIQAFNHLASQVHPLALGNVKRSLSQSRMMAKKLLSLHMKQDSDDHKIREIVDNLTSKMFFHGHPINRIEARDQIGLPSVDDPSEEVEDAMWRLYMEYEKDMQLDVPFNAAFEFLEQFPNQPQGAAGVTPLKTMNLAYIESEVQTDVLSLDYQLSGQRDPSGITRVQLLPSRQNWKLE